MDNKTFRTEQLKTAGWILKTPQSGYWHRPGVGIYFNLNDAYEQQLQFPEMVRQALLSQNSKIEFKLKSLNPDATNAAIASRQLAEFSRNFLVGMGGNGPLGIETPTPGQTYVYQYNDPTPPVRLIKRTAPRYKIATIGNGFAVVDTDSGRSIHQFTGTHTRERATTICELYNQQQATMDEALTKTVLPQAPAALPVGVSRPAQVAGSEWTNTLLNLDSEIEYLNRVRVAVASRNTVLLKTLVDNSSGRAKNTCFRFITIALLRLLGINEDTIKQ